MPDQATPFAVPDVDPTREFPGPMKASPAGRYVAWTLGSIRGFADFGQFNNGHARKPQDRSQPITLATASLDEVALRRVLPPIANGKTEFAYSNIGHVLPIC